MIEEPKSIYEEGMGYALLKYIQQITIDDKIDPMEMILFSVVVKN